MIKSLKIFFIFLGFFSFITAQSHLILQNGTSFYVPFGGQFCSDSIVVHLGASYTTDELNGTCDNAVISGEGVIVLPVELISFTAKLYGNKYVFLEWETASEINNFGFEIELSENKISWSKIAFVNGNGNSSSPQKYSYRDIRTGPVDYWYRLKQINTDGTYWHSNEVKLVVDRSTKEYVLEPNYPNPFNPTTIIEFGIPEKGAVRLSILNTLGEEVKVLLNEEKEAGYYSVDFNAGNLPSGVYFYQLKAGNFIDTKKMLLLK